MASQAEHSPVVPAAFSKRRWRWRKLALWFVSIVAAIGVLGFFAAPPLLRSKLTNDLSKQLRRPVAIEQIQINPYLMTATVRGLVVKERQGDQTAFSFNELFADLEAQSLFRLAPVLKELRLIKPYVRLARNENGSYNFQDLIDEFMAAPSGPTPRFAIHNIRIADGEIDFDDRPKQARHKVSSMNIGIPFISSIPSQSDIKVLPSFSAQVNGSPVALGGETQPFKDSLESQFQITIDKLSLPKYLEYSPVKLNFSAPSGHVDGKLTVTFRTPKNQPAALALSGHCTVKELTFQAADATALLKLPVLEAHLDALELPARKAIVKKVRLQGTELHVRRGRDGRLNLENLVVLPETNTPAEKPTESPFGFQIDDIILESAKVQFVDQVPERGYQARFDNLSLAIKGLTNESGKPASIDLAFESPQQERFKHTGSVQLAPLKMDGKLEIEGLRPAALKPYYEKTLAADIKEGFLDLVTTYALEEKADKHALKLSETSATVRSLRIDEPGRRDPLWTVPFLGIKEVSIDLDGKSIVIGKVEGRDGSGYAQRNADGSLNYDKLIKPTVSNQGAKPAGPATGDEWKIVAKQIALDRFKVAFEDRAPPTPVKVNLADLSLRLENVSNAKNQRSKTTLQTRINNKGLLRLTGSAGFNPPVANFAVTGRDVEMLPFQPYLENQVLFLLTSGQVGTEGKLVFDGSGQGPAKVNYEGSLQVADFATVEKSNAQDLLKWKSLALNGIQLTLEPMQLRIAEINLADFYSRLILAADGKINLQNLMKPGEQKDEPAKGAPADKPAAVETPAGDKAITIGKINLQGGNVNFSDFFIKPNYTANLTSVQGTISELKPETPGDLEIVAKLDNAAPVDIRGKINPLAKNLFMDIVADAREIDLPPFSPYSGKYVGYGIERGKLSFNVKYKIADRKLEADNKIILNQLTFGEKINSPDATSLPVLLAVALLKDRNGVIDINLPIGGSLDDPKFSVGGIVWQIILNILVKAVTSPFALLGAAFGGGGEELSYIEFDYGRAAVPQSGEAKIKSLVGAMNNRPALKLEISGRVDPAADLDGIKKVAIERKVKAQKLKDLLRQGSAPASVDEVNIEKDEYEKYLKLAYGDENFAKPRNLVGLAKDLPVAEMEELMTKNTKVSDDDLRELANRRAQAVRDRVLAAGPITADRLFIVTAKPGAEADKEKAKLKTSRVDFSLR